MRLVWLLVLFCLLFLGSPTSSLASRGWHRHKLKHRYPEPKFRWPRRKFKGGTVRHPLFEGSGCPPASVLLVNASDTTSFSLSALFSEFQAQTTDVTTHQRKTCSITVALEPQANMSIGVSYVDFRGSAYVPASVSPTQQLRGSMRHRQGSRKQKATLKASYRVTGSRRERAVDRTFDAGFDDAFYEAVDVDAVVWTPCDAGLSGRVYEFRIVATITASKAAAEDEDVSIAVDTSDSSLQRGLYYELTSRPCGAVATDSTSVPGDSPVAPSGLIGTAVAESETTA